MVTILVVDCTTHFMRNTLSTYMYCRRYPPSVSGGTPFTKYVMALRRLDLSNIISVEESLLLSLRVLFIMEFAFITAITVYESYRLDCE